MVADGALLRDPRATERKKTGLAKARKRVSMTLPPWTYADAATVRVGQAMI